MAIIGEQVVWITTRRCEFIRLHGQAGHKAGYVVGRPTEHTIRQVRDFSMPNHPPLQVVARLGPQIVNRVSVAVLFEGQRLAIRRVSLHVVDGSHRTGGVAERRVGGDILDSFLANIDHPSILKGFQMLLTSLQHGCLLYISSV